MTFRGARAVVTVALLSGAIAGCSGGSALPSAQLDTVVAAIRAQYADVIDATLSDGLLMIRVRGSWTEAGATRLACETVKPILAGQGAGGQQFAIYDQAGTVIATGSRCH